jgi:DNA helicase-2/ATP-dependent DNA helicase PcrA
MELCERIIDGDKLPTGMKPAIKTKLANFVGVVRKLRRAADKVGGARSKLVTKLVSIEADLI